LGVIAPPALINSNLNFEIATYGEDYDGSLYYCGIEPYMYFIGNTAEANAALIRPWQSNYDDYISLNEESGFITKDAFYAQDNYGVLVNLSSVSPINQELYVNRSLVLALPGLNGFEHIGWGIWNIRSDGIGTGLGFFAFIQAGTLDYNYEEFKANIPNPAEIGAQVVDYRGIAMGQIYDVNTMMLPDLAVGTAQMSVNFGSGAITNGAINLTDSMHNVNIGFGGQINAFGTAAYNGTFSGNTVLNGTQVANGVRGMLVEQEAVGTFNARDTSTVVTGAFGMSTDRVLPTKPISNEQIMPAP
jgi:hypothetical protein